MTPPQTTRSPWAAFDGDTPRVRHPIATAPKDGTLIMVGDPDVGEFPMRWGHIQRNEFFAPGSVGMWIMIDGSMTWSEADDCGPTTWRESTPTPDAKERE
jgi:hypothetical protein